MVAALDAQMRDSDAFSWYMEEDPLMRSTIVAVALLDRAPDWDRLVDKVDRSNRQIPGFRQLVASVPVPLRLATPRWIGDPDFDLSWHLRRVDAPPPRDLSAVVSFARTAGMQGFDRARPLWEFTLMEGLEGGRAAFVMKVHHSLTDGVGGMQLALLLFDLQAEPIDLGPLPEAPEAARHTAAELGRAAVGEQLRRFAALARRGALRVLPATVRALEHPRRAAAEAAALAGSVYRMVAPVNDTMSPVMRDRRLGWRYDLLDVPLADLKRSANSVGCTLNDGFLAGVAGGLRRYHELHDTSVDRLRMTLPVSIRREGDPMGGNRISLLRFPIPVGVADPVGRLKAMHEVIGRARSEPALPHTNAVAAALNFLPSSYVGGMIKHVDFVGSDVPGFPFPVYLAGSRVERYHAFGPTIGTALNVTLLSYCGTCHVGITTDVGAVTDHDVLVACLADGFEEVLAVAGPHGSVERPLHPGSTPLAA